MYRELPHNFQQMDTIILFFFFPFPPPHTQKTAEVISSEAPSTVDQKPEEPVPVELLSDVAALGSRLTHEELGRCSPRELGLMHEQLGGMMRSIVDHLQSRLVSNLEDRLS